MAGSERGTTANYSIRLNKVKDEKYIDILNEQGSTVAVKRALRVYDKIIKREVKKAHGDYESLQESMLMYGIELTDDEAKRWIEERS